MRGQAANIYATSADMLELCKKFEDNISFCYAFIERHTSPKIVLSTTASDIDLFWTSPSGFLGRTILLIPKGYEPIPRTIKLRGGGVNYALYPVDVDTCVALQEGGVFSQGDCLISGRLTNTFSDEWSKSTFGSLVEVMSKNFSRIRSYYLGPEAKQRFEKGYRLTNQASAPRDYDLSS